MVKSARWLPLRNRAKLSEKQDVKLQELLAANQPLAMVYVLKEGLEGHLVCAERVGRMATMAELDAAGEGEVRRAAATIWSNLSKYSVGILASANTRCTMSVLEGEQDQSDKAHGIWI